MVGPIPPHTTVIISVGYFLDGLRLGTHINTGGIKVADRDTKQLVKDIPQAPEAERAVLGAIISNPDHFNAIQANVSLEPAHFFSQANHKIFSVMAELDSAGVPMDVVTVIDALRKSGDNDLINPTYIVELPESAPVSKNVEHYARIVKNKFQLRCIIDACNSAKDRAAGNSSDDISDLIDTIEKEILSIRNQHDQGGLTKASDILESTLEELEERISNDGSITGVVSGFSDLDGITAGFQRSDLIILAARPAMGKTALALNFATNALKSGARVAFFSLEMSKEQLLMRIMSAEGRLDSSRLRKGDLNEDDQDRLVHAARVINGYSEQLAIDDTAGITLAELRSRCRRFQRENGLDLILIDYLQLMSGSREVRKQGREREVSEISMGLKSLAKELNVPVITLAQLNRGPDARPDKRPKISDLRESGSMEQDADLIFFVYRDEYYNPNSEDTGKAEVIIAKNRHGGLETVKLAWLPNFVSFHNLLQE